MSKAFTKDDDGVPTPEPSAPGVLPPGTPNLVTIDGYTRLQARVAALESTGDDVVARALASRLEQTTRVPPNSTPATRFGDAVEVEITDASGPHRRRLRIVGIDEVGLAQPEGIEPLSWLTPLARTLIGAEVGDLLTTTGATGGPRVEVEVEVIARLALPPFTADPTPS